ncbi:hypothetical protein YW7DRAFT_04926 [Streptomyces sp. AmelKG-E11A]|nr:hypothetical protein YW7DRAFT_04926 [Streptomyces sp. AmelKG-E11A]
MTDRTEPVPAREARPSADMCCPDDRPGFLRPAHEVTGISAHEGSCADSGQVFGLAGTFAGLPADSYWPSLPRPGRAQCV